MVKSFLLIVEVLRGGKGGATSDPVALLTCGTNSGVHGFHKSEFIASQTTFPVEPLLLLLNFEDDVALAALTGALFTAYCIPLTCSGC